MKLKPLLQIVASDLSKNEAEALEIKEIANRRNLLNSAHGGLINHGFKLSNETKKLMSSQRKGERNPFFKKTHSSETVSKIQKAVRKPIKDSNGFIYNSMSDASKALGIPVQNISAVIRNKRKSAGGLSFILLEV